jgi:hypothetical protein
MHAELDWLGDGDEIGPAAQCILRAGG